MTDKKEKTILHKDESTQNPQYGPKIDRKTGRIEFTDSYSEFMDTFRKEQGYSGSQQPFVSRTASMESAAADRDNIRADRKLLHL